MRSSAIVLFALLVACDDKKPTQATAPSASVSPSVTAPPVASSAAPPPAATPTAPPEQIAAQHILVAWKGAKNAPASITRSKIDAKKRADEAAAKAKEKGADFSALVGEYSDDEGTKGRQGSLGKFAKSKMTPAFADAAFALSVDQVSDPVETPFGYHVIKRNQ
jgi:peptidyl-prolyl cis-trans isomerase NIMA-interacting 1